MNTVVLKMYFENNIRKLITNFSKHGFSSSLILLVLVLFSLAPFVTKPFNIDDSLFIWAAKHVRYFPLNPYGFQINWYGEIDNMWTVTQNPPLTCYYLAFWAVLFGWSETALHAAQFLPTVIAAFGIYRLAKRFCCFPFPAALAAVFTPAFLVSSTTLMCDIPMLAFWVWSIELWMEGLKADNNKNLAMASLFITSAALTKYFGICLIPLLAAWSLMSKRKVQGWIIWLTIPIIVLIVYQSAVFFCYGTNLFVQVGQYAISAHSSNGQDNLQMILEALVFTGGCLATTLFFLPILWSFRQIAVWGLFSIIVISNICLTSSVARQFSIRDDSSWLAIQFICWATSGVGVLILGICDVMKNKNADSWLLLMWVFGVFLFTAFFNWTVNARSILPMSVPIGILIVRRMEWRFVENRVRMCCLMTISLAMSIYFALWVTKADYLYAKAMRDTTVRVAANYGGKSREMWFGGHWGFQYYMEEFGAKAINVYNMYGDLKPGDYVAFPENNTNPLIGDTLRGGTLVQKYFTPIPGRLSTVNCYVGAGFYSSSLGPLPFAFGKTRPEEVTVFIMNATNHESLKL